MMNDRDLDILKQGFMKEPKKRRGPQKSKAEQAQEIMDRTGIPCRYNGEAFLLTRPEGTEVYAGGKTTALDVAKRIARE